MSVLPSEASVVVIGGGIMGCSTAYHLAKAGQKNVVLLERKQLTCGTTWHSAAQVRQLRSSANLTRLIGHSARLYQSLEAETGQATGWLSQGSLSIATNADRFTHIKRQAALARLFGLEVEVIGAEEAGRMWPLIRTDDLIGAVYARADGRVNPSDVCAALVKGAKAMGVQVFEDTPVSGFEKTRGRVSAVVTAKGCIACEAVALTAGLWSREVAAMAGVTAPLFACEHFYLLTEPMGIEGHLPTLSDHDGHLYIRDEVGGLLVGCFEPDAKPLPLEKLPKDFAFDLLNEDWDHFEPMLENAIHRIPALADTGARMLLNGPESFTPDGNFILGESPELDGFYLGCGMNSVGVASGGGAGMALAEWIVEGRPTMDLAEVDARRFAPFQGNLKALFERIPEELGHHYAISYPGRRPETVRGLRRSPVHALLTEAGASFGVRAGWERPEYFVAEGQTIEHRPCFGRPPWFGAVATEHLAARQAAALFDQSSFAKFRVEGPGALAFLQRLSSNDLDVAPDRIVYTLMLNDRGGVEAEMTVLRLAEDAFLLVAGTGTEPRLKAWLRRRMADMNGTGVTVTDMTSAYGILALAGPKAAELMERVSPADVSAEGFKRYRQRVIELGYAHVRAARLSYAGEDGFELFVASEFALQVSETLLEAGAEFGLHHGGTLALSGLRIERGFRAWGHDMGAGDTALEAGLENVIRFGKPGGFIGEDALSAQRASGLKRRLVHIVLEDADAYPIGGEPILHASKPVGQVTSAAFGHTLGRAVAIGYVERAPEEIDRMVAAGGFALDIAGQWAPAHIGFVPPLAAHQAAG
jgi:glycine cleavage system aminomethyltransferase T/glycine/D-amino acid oxidase-like deaminating enzyme